MKNKLLVKTKTSRPIASLADLQMQKKALENKIQKKQKKINKRIKKLSQIATPQNVYSELLQHFEFDESIILNLLPHALKKGNEFGLNLKNVSPKTLAWIAAGGIGAGLSGYLLYQNSKKETNTEIDDLFI